MKKCILTAKTRYHLHAWLPLCGLLSLMLATPSAQPADNGAASDYVIAVSGATAANEDWTPVREALLEKHANLHPSVLVYQESVLEVLPGLKELKPRYTCFLSPHSEVDKELVADIHRLTRRLDDDPYSDTFWGMLTGYDRDNALAIARRSEPLRIEKVLAATEIAMDKVPEGRWYCELKKGHCVRKERGGTAKAFECPADTTSMLVDTLNNYQPDLLITSGHATARDWQIGYAYRNGVFRSEDGKLYGVDTAGERHAVDSHNPKVYLPVGNCLMGSIPDKNAMALAWMKSAGVVQMIGYTVATWFGYAGWGMLDYFLEQPGRYTLTQAFFANQHALVHAIETGEGNRRGLVFDSTVLAFYGDPAWEARMVDGPLHYDQELAIEGEIYRLTITPRKGADSFATVSSNGSQRGGRPIIAFLPHPIPNEKELLQGADLNPLLADDFILIPRPKACEPGRTYSVSFRVRR